MSEREELQKSLAALEAQRALLGEAVIGPAIAALREKLTALETQEQVTSQPVGGKRQRKLVTVMFADLVNFTAIAEHMDPEDVQVLIKTYFDRWKEIIEQHGGSVEKFIGDAVMAVWGAQVAREDDAERAIRAALIMREALRVETWSLQVSNRQRDENPFLASGLHMRIGINTGLVLVGELADNAQFTIIGDTVNTASRMEHAAPVDGILISHDTYRQVTGLFEVQTVEPLALKGKSEPVQTYLVFQANPQTFRSGTRGVEGIQTRMVGRESELEVLKNAWESLAASGAQGNAPHNFPQPNHSMPVREVGYRILSHQDLDAFSMESIDTPRSGERTARGEPRARNITVLAEAGLGKSRLLYEFQNWMDANPRFYYRFQARAVEQMSEVPFALLRNLFAMRFQIQDSDSPAAARQKLEEGFLQFWDHSAQEKIHFIGQLLGYDYSASPFLRGIQFDFKQIRDRATLYLVEFFNAAALRQPLVICLEDVHWADENSLDLLRQVQQSASDKPIFILAMARPALFERYPQWGQGEIDHRILPLKPLSKVDTYILIEDILRKVRRIPSSLRELVAEEAEGNPFYVEELIKMLIDEGVILKSDHPDKEGGQWRVVTERLTRLHVPPTLTGVLQARLDALPAVEREILQAASVVGRTFWGDAVRCLLENSPDQALRQQAGNIEQVFQQLSQHELVFQRRSSSFVDTSEYVFKHSILHEVTYETVLKSNRRVYHGAMAQWFSGRGGERAEEYAGMIAAHYEKAEDILQAAAWYFRAGKRASQQYAGQDALSYLNKALDLTPMDRLSERYAILRERVEMHDLAGSRGQQAEDLDLLADLAERLDSIPCRVETSILHANMFETTGNYITAQAMAQSAIQLMEDDPDSRNSQPGILLLAEAHMAWGVAALRNEEYANAHQAFQRSLSLARQAAPNAKSMHLQAEVLRHLGNLFYFQNNTQAGYNNLNQALELYRSLGDLRGESYTLVSLGVLAVQSNRLTEAIDFQERALKVSEKIGDQLGQARALNNMGDVYAQMGDYARAMPDMVYSYEIFDRINHRHGKIVSLANLQDIYLRLGKFDQALSCNRKWLDLARQTDDRLAHALAYQGAAFFSMWVGLYPRAKEYLDLSAEIIDEIGDLTRKAGLRYTYAIWAVRACETREAVHRVNEALLMAQSVKDTLLQALVWTLVGQALIRDGQYDQACAAFQQAEQLHREHGFPGRAIEALLYQGAATLAQGAAPTALGLARPFLEYIQSSPLGLLEDLFGDFWIAYQILRANQDPRAATLLSRAHDMLLSRARQVQDAEIRRSYLEEIPAHCSIQLEWQAETR